jgi:hypothetical protein
VLHAAGNKYHPLLHIWLTVALSDNGPFQVFLANAAVEYSRSIGNKTVESIDAVKYYTTALQILGSKLGNAKHAVSEGAIATILGFACQDVCI